jgi:hypothetical protein
MSRTDQAPHHLNTRNARRVFHRLGLPRDSSGKYVFPV